MAVSNILLGIANDMAKNVNERRQLFGSFGYCWYKLIKE